MTARTHFIARVAIFGLHALSAFGQSNTATILGNMTGSSGAAIPGVRVIVTNVKTQVIRATSADEGGSFACSLMCSTSARP